VIVLGDSDDEVPTELLNIVSAALNDEDVRPLTDQVVVEAAETVSINVTATLFIPPGPDDGLVRAAAEASLDAYFASIRRVGSNVAFSGIAAALHVESVIRVAFIAPVADIQIDEAEAPVKGTVTLTVEVISNV
jgi:phage-related baseplate assembly protein